MFPYLTKVYILSCKSLNKPQIQETSCAKAQHNKIGQTTRLLIQNNSSWKTVERQTNKHEHNHQPRIKVLKRK